MKKGGDKTVERLDHLVLTVRDVDLTCEFYERVLGMEVITFGQGRKALRFGHSKINLHPLGKELEPKAHRPTPGSADLCFIVTTSIREMTERLQTIGLAVIEGPVRTHGATGPIVSVYFRDPDLNLIEVSNEL